MMFRLVTIAMLLGESSALAGEPVWRECQIQAGRIGSCGKRASGDGVAFHGGAYRRCHFEDGRLESCSRRFSGVLALVDDDGSYRACEIRSGRQSTCASLFTGTQFLAAD